MAPKLYADPPSPPCRAVMMVCEALNIPIEFVNTTLANMDHLKEDFVKKSPMHTVPLLEDGDLIIHDSHVIITYLVDKYGKSDAEKWYPKDVKLRARVDQKLYLDALLYSKMRAITYPAFAEGVRKPSEKVKGELIQMYEFLEKFLSRTKYVAADHMTVADISVVAVMSTSNLLIPVDASKFPKTSAWLKVMEKQNFYQKQNIEGLQKMSALIKHCLDL